MAEIIKMTWWLWFTVKRQFNMIWVIAMIVELIVEIMMRPLTIRLVIERRTFRRTIGGDQHCAEHCRFTGKETVLLLDLRPVVDHKVVIVFCLHLSRLSIVRGLKEFSRDWEREREFRGGVKPSEVKAKTEKKNNSCCRLNLIPLARQPTEREAGCHSMAHRSFL